MANKPFIPVDTQRIAALLEPVIMAYRLSGKILRVESYEKVFSVEVYSTENIPIGCAQIRVQEDGVIINGFSHINTLKKPYRADKKTYEDIPRFFTSAMNFIEKFTEK